MFERIIKICWILVALVITSKFVYEVWAPCGLRSMRRDTMQWIETCSDNSGEAHE